MDIWNKLKCGIFTEITRDWVDVPEGIKLFNPAFETVNRQYISGLITEAGIFPSGEVHTIFREAIGS